MKVGFNNHSIELAKEVVLRAQLTQAEKGENLCFASEQCVPTAFPSALSDQARWGSPVHADYASCGAQEFKLKVRVPAKICSKIYDD